MPQQFPTPAYVEALEAYRLAAEDFRSVQRRYRAGEIDDLAFDEALGAYHEAKVAMDAVEERERIELAAAFGEDD